MIHPKRTLAMTLGVLSTPFTTFAQPVPVVAQAPAATAIALEGAPTVGTLHLHAGFAPDPVRVGVPSGGPVEHPTCGGYVSAQPQLVMDVAGNLPWLRVFVASDGDVGLRMLGPDGQWRCAEDTYGTYPAVDGRFRHGVWRVWVSTQSPNEAGTSARVSFTTHRAEVPHPAGGAARGRPDAMHDVSEFAQGVVNAFEGTPGQGTPPPGASAPPQSPLSQLTRAGIDPARAAESLLSLFQRGNNGANTLAPGQVAQLDQLGHSGLTVNQLEAIVSSMLQPGAAPAGAPAGFDPAGLQRIAELARAGATLVQLQSAASELLGPLFNPGGPGGGP